MLLLLLAQHHVGGLLTPFDRSHRVRRMVSGTTAGRTVGRPPARASPSATRDYIYLRLISGPIRRARRGPQTTADDKIAEVKRGHLWTTRVSAGTSLSRFSGFLRIVLPRYARWGRWGGRL